jgi:hypothetical protein
MKMVPTGSAVVNQALVLLAGSLLAALIVGQLPGVKAWIREQWA